MDAEDARLLREIRDEVRRTIAGVDRMNARVGQMNARLGRDDAMSCDASARLDRSSAVLHARVGQTSVRLDGVETALRDLAEQQRLTLRHLLALAERDPRFPQEVIELRAWLDRVDGDLGPE